MSTIKAYNSLKAEFARGGYFEPTAANFPACAHFWKCDESTGVGGIVDCINGVVLNSSLTPGLTNNGDGTISLGETFDTIIAGSLASPGTKNILVMFGGKPAATLNGIAFGNITTGPGFRSIGTAAGTPAAWGTGGGALVTGTVGLVGTGAQKQSRALAIAWGSATGLMPYDWDGTTCVARAAAGNLAGHTGITTMNQAVSIGGQAYPGYIQIWHCTTLPSAAEIQSAMLWTHARAFTAPFNKYLYPGFRGRT